MPRIVAFVCSPLCHHLYTIFYIISWVCSFVSSTYKPLFMFLHLILCCPSSYCIPHAIIKFRMTILISYFPCLAALFLPREDCSISPLKPLFAYLWHHSLPTFGSEIALSARISAPSFAGSPRCAFTLTKKVAVPAAILFRSISMAAARISASGAPTNVAFPPSTMTGRHTNIATAPLSACHEAPVKTLPIQADLSWSPLPHVPLCTAAFFPPFSSHHILLPFCLFCLSHHLPLLGPKTHTSGLRACLSLCPSSNRVLSLSIALDIRLLFLMLRPLWDFTSCVRSSFSVLQRWHVLCQRTR